MNRFTRLTIMAALLAGCAVPARNYSLAEADQLWETSTFASKMTATGESTYNVAYEEALQRAETGASRCFDRRVVYQGNAYTRDAGGMTDYSHELVQLSPEAALLGVRMHTYGLVQFPDSYKMIARMEKAGDSTTRVKYKHPVANGNGAVAQLDGWLKTGAIACADID